MQLHANAALSLNGRRRMVVAVVGRGRSITEAAEAAGERPDLLEVGGALSRRRGGWSARSVLGTQAGREPD